MDTHVEGERGIRRTGSGPRRWAVAAVALVASTMLASTVAARTLHAQQLFGVLRVQTPPQPAAGVVITATRAADGTVLARTVTGPSGSFRLEVGGDSVTVRALRIGQRPVTLFVGRLPAGERRDIGRVLPDEPAVIATVRVRETARCGVPTDDGSVVSALFADALTALAASVSTSEGTAPVVRTLSLEEERDRRDALEVVRTPVVREGAVLQPYRSVPVPTLLREGFVSEDATGDQLYRAPDALVLTDDRFLAGTCLSLDRSREDSGVVGIGFAPARRTRGRVDVRGVLWLDAQSRTLQRLEFGYVGLPGASASMNPGGSVEYVQLPDGRWIIDRWALRMPRLVTEQTAAPGARGASTQTRATGARVVRGMVTEVWLGDRALYSVGGAPGESALLRTLQGGLGAPGAAARVPASSRGLAATSGAASLAALAETRHCEATASTATLALGVLVLDAQGAPRPGARVEAVWRRRFVPGEGTTGAWELAEQSGTSNADGVVVLCGVTRRQPVVVRALVDGCPATELPFRPSERAERSEVALRLAPGCGGAARE